MPFLKGLENAVSRLRSITHEDPANDPSGVAFWAGFGVRRTWAMTSCRPSFFALALALCFEQRRLTPLSRGATEGGKEREKQSSLNEPGPWNLSSPISVSLPIPPCCPLFSPFGWFPRSPHNCRPLLSQRAPRKHLRGLGVSVWDLIGPRSNLFVPVLHLHGGRGGKKNQGRLSSFRSRAMSCYPMPHPTAASRVRPAYR